MKLKLVSFLCNSLLRMVSEREQLEVAYLDLQEKCRPFQVHTFILTAERQRDRGKREREREGVCECV